jgi:hypothetical protein
MPQIELRNPWIAAVNEMLLAVAEWLISNRHFSATDETPGPSRPP